MKSIERYSLACWRCNSDIEIPCRAPHHCSKCGALLVIDWRPTQET
jgi:rRNA maturation endonuclease Nob1